MTLEQYNQIISNLDQQINELLQNKHDIIKIHEKKLSSFVEKRHNDDRHWFVCNFDVIWANRQLFAENTVNSNIIIDFFEIYLVGIDPKNSISQISIGELLSLWNIGFRYNGYPIVELVKHRFKSRLSYIKDGKLETLSGFSLDDLHFSPLLRGVLDYMAKHCPKYNKFDIYRTIADMKSLLAQ